MKKVLFFSCEPGGAEVLIPVIRLLQEHAFDVCVLSYGLAADRFRRSDIAFFEMDPGRSALSLLDHVCPDYVITSATSLPWKDMTEKHLWRAARRIGIGTMAFIDQWQNYSERFSGPTSGEKLKRLPDHINCIDEIGRREMIAEGFPEKSLIAFGHPYLSEVVARYSAMAFQEAVFALGIPPGDFSPEEALLFVSEPLLENYGNGRGYNQYGVLDFFLQNVLRSRPGARVIVKLHPKDDPENFSELLDRFAGLRLHIVGKELSSLQCLALSERIFGMTSIVLIEAYLIGKAVVSLQPGLRISDPLVLSRYGLIPRFDAHSDFDPFACEGARSSKFHVDFDRPGFLAFLKIRLGLEGRPPLQKGMRVS